MRVASIRKIVALGDIEPWWSDASTEIERQLQATQVRPAHITSIQRRMPLFEATLAYAAAKAALTTYSKGLANEVGSEGVRVNTVAPGFSETAAAACLIERLFQQAAIDTHAARRQLMDSLGGIRSDVRDSPTKLPNLSPS